MPSTPLLLLALGCVKTAGPSSPLAVDGVVAWLDQTALPLSADLSAPPADITKIGQVIGDRRVVAMGETTHGTKEFFDLKHRFFRYLVEERGFRTLAMEMTRDAGDAVNHFVRTGEGDPRALLQGSYFFFDAKEMLELILWMRAYNEHRPTEEQVFFMGFDTPGTPAADVIAERCGERLGCQVVMRDALMAKHVHDWLDQHPGGALVWAHNGHAAHFESTDGWRTMGHYLRESLGEDYYAIGFEFNRGSFVAPAGGDLPVLRSVALEHLGGLVFSEYLLPPAPSESLAFRLSQAREDDYFVDLRAAPAVVRSFFESNRNLQSYGATPPHKDRQYEQYAPLQLIFDGLIFVETTHGYGFNGS